MTKIPLVVAFVALAACSADGAEGALPRATEATRVPAHRQTFAYAPYAQTFEVPAGVTELTIDAIGASGTAQ